MFVLLLDTRSRERESKRMATALLSVPASHHQTPVSQRPSTTSNSWFHGSITSVKYPYKPAVLLSSSSSSSSVVEDEPSPPPPDSVPVQSDSATAEEADKVPFRGCKACGREELERGCNGEGRIQGGIATVPGFGWWPIKAYRPCPGFVASGGRYRRRGQSMDEVAFGRGERRTPVSTGNEDKPSKKLGGKKIKK